MLKSVSAAKLKQTIVSKGQPESIVVKGNIRWFGQKVARK
jgi:hypothetical protein